MVETLERPSAPQSLPERVRAWVEWFGIARLLAASVATVVVCVGGLWLVRTPPPATEASLPQATNTTTTNSTAAAIAVGPVGAPPTTDGRGDIVVLVHVAGAVVEPGVYELVGDARVRDAIVAAGGPTGAADWNALNLAAPVVDGVKVYVPMVGEEVAAPLTVLSGPGTQPVTPIDVNAATASELESLPGVGPATAMAIVDERERNGPFLDADDLERVPGIGPSKLDALRELVTT